MLFGKAASRVSWISNLCNLKIWPMHPARLSKVVEDVSLATPLMVELSGNAASRLSWRSKHCTSNVGSNHGDKAHHRATAIHGHYRLASKDLVIQIVNIRPCEEASILHKSPSSDSVYTYARLRL